MKKITDTYTLNNGVDIPCVGFGTWQTPNDEVGYKSVKVALEAGYRHIDTATVYGNEESVGQAINDSQVPREEIFLTTKLWNDKHGYEETLEAFQESLDLLGVDYVDLYLIHWPNPPKYRNKWEEVNGATWKAMEEIYRSGKAKAIGVSNFRVHHLEELLKTAEIKPMVNQIRLCPGDAPKDLIDYCREKDMLLEAYSPLGTGKIFQVPEMVSLADKHKTTVANIALKWNLNKGFLPLPKSVTPERIIANTQFLDIQLSEEDMTIIDGLEGVCGYSTDPDTTTW